MTPEPTPQAQRHQRSTAALACIECGTTWQLESERWRLKVLFEESPPLCALYCPACHGREFEG